MPREADRVAEVSTTVGSGPLVLGGAQPGHRTFLAAFGAGVHEVSYGILLPTTGEWENGIGTYASGSNSLARDTPLTSSSGGSRIVFGAGDKVVYIGRQAETPLTVRIARPGDIGLDMQAAPGQSAALLRLRNDTGGDAFTVANNGLVSAGAATLRSSAPVVTLAESTVTAPGGRWRFKASGGLLELQRSTAGEFQSVENMMRARSTGIQFPTEVQFDKPVSLKAPRIDPETSTNGAVILTLGGDRPMEFRQRGDGAAAAIELAPIAFPTPFRITGAAGLGGFEFRPNGDFGPEIRKLGNVANELLTIDGGTGLIDFRLDGTLVARVAEGGTAVGAGVSIITREKGDARYTLASSSAELKREIEALLPVDLSAVAPRRFVWNMDGHPRDGLAGAGFIYEDVAAVFPEATYPAGKGRPGGLDPLALLAGFVAEFRARLDAIEAKIEGTAHARQPRSRKRS